MAQEIPIFPLNTVLYPGGKLPLRIFETRYLDMVSQCLKNEQGFGVCLIQEGAEAGRAKVHVCGTLAEIRDWSRGDDGLLHILGQGTRRFRISQHRIQADGLNLAEVEWLAAETPAEVPAAQQHLVELLRQLLQQLELQEATADGTSYADAGWVGYRLAELLPISLPQRQYLLELSDPVKRLEILATLVLAFASQ